MGKGDKQRRKTRRAQKRTLASMTAPHRPKRASQPLPSGPVERPTPERAARGRWTQPDEKSAALVDLQSDVVGWLYETQQITTQQEHAARTFQSLRAAYMAELPEVSGYRSCLAGSTQGFDDGDGDPVVIVEYRTIERIVGLRGRVELLRVCEDQQPPVSLPILAAALDAIAGGKRR